MAFSTVGENSRRGPPPGHGVPNFTSKIAATPGGIPPRSGR